MLPLEKNPENCWAFKAMAKSFATEDFSVRISKMNLPGQAVQYYYCTKINNNQAKKQEYSEYFIILCKKRNVSLQKSFFKTKQTILLTFMAR